MKKIPSVFQRNYETDHLIRDEVVPGCEWVLAGEGVATRKWDGTACLVRDGKLYKRYDAKKGKAPPANWESCEEFPDAKTGHWPGWLPVGGGPEDKWHRGSWAGHEGLSECLLEDGTYELIGPSVNDNRDAAPIHYLVRHGTQTYADFPRTFLGLKEFLAAAHIEGLVFHHPDGRMAKVKARDFGLPWPIKGEG